MNCVNGPCAAFVASARKEFVTNALIVNETVNYMSFLSVSLANVNFMIVIPVIVSCVTVGLAILTVNLVSKYPKTTLLL